MGKRSARRSRAIEQARGAATGRREFYQTEEVRAAEDQLRAAEGYLGTEEQFTGQLAQGLDQDLLGYTERFELDPVMSDKARQINRSLSNQQSESWFAGLEGITSETGLQFFGDPIDPRSTTGRFGTGLGQPEQNIGTTAHPTESGRIGGNLGRTFGNQLGDPYELVTSKANEILDAAEAAARAGNLDEAQKLKDQASGLVSQLHFEGVNQDELFRMTGGITPDARAREMVSTPIARNIGQLVGQAEDYLDPESEAARGLRETVTADARREIDYATTKSIRGLAAGERGAQRQMRDFRLATGGAANLNAIHANIGRIKEAFAADVAGTHERAGQELASITQEAAQWYEGFSRDFASQTSNMAQAFLQNSAGVRDQFIQVTTNLAIATMGYVNASADRATSWAEQEAEMVFQKQMAALQLGGQLGGALLGGASSFLGAKYGND